MFYVSGFAALIIFVYGIFYRKRWLRFIKLCHFNGTPNKYAIQFFKLGIFGMCSFGYALLYRHYKLELIFWEYIKLYDDLESAI